jgi:autotransporter-associated beta strand protein
VSGPVSANLLNSGLVDFNLSSDTSIQMNISGSGNLRISGSGQVTLTGDNTYTGNTTIASGSSLVAGTNTALGSAPQLMTDGGYFGTLSGIVLPSLSATGGVVKLTSDITTVGEQSYDSIVLAKSNSSNTLTLSTSDSNITITGSINDAIAKTSSMVIDAGTADVILGDSIGNVARFNAFTVTGENIYILADILTGTTQTYNGNIRIGSGSYIGKQFVVGFLFASHNQYFKYGTGAAASSYDYKNNDPRYVRTLISEDPMVTFNGPVDDVAEYTHTLLVAAIAPNIGSANATPPQINFEQPVSSILPLYSLNAQAIITDTSMPCAVCEINLTGGVKTYGSQTYRAGLMNANAITPGGDVTFSVYDPNASINYILPLQSNGQINLQNPGSSDGLIINGKNNFSAVANFTGTNNWGASRFKEGLALGALLISSDTKIDLVKLKKQSELTKEDNLIVGEVTIDEMEDTSDCAKQDQDSTKKPDPKCSFESI